MSELRQDLTTGEWVIVAPERGARPHDFRQREEDRTPLRNDCPFCPGHESMTPPEVERMRLSADEHPWRVRVVANRYPALSPDAPVEQLVVPPPFEAWSGSGAHEVIIETAQHDRLFPDMAPEEAGLVYEALQRRYRALSRLPGVKAIALFKNHGVRAGASLSHPHSQIIATPVIPSRVQQKLETARAYRRRHGRCLYAHLVEAEQEAGTRLLFVTDGLVAFLPHASRWPFETWLVPQPGTPEYGLLDSTALTHLATAVQRVLGSIRGVVGTFAYNVLFHLPPVGEASRDAHPWWLQIVPRLVTWAGFELITGVHINPLSPEDGTVLLRASTQGRPGG